MRLIPALIFSLIITTIFLVLYNLEPGLSQNPLFATEIAARAFQTVDKLYTETSYSFQLHKNFNRLQQQLDSEISFLMKTRREPDYLARILPEHDLAIAHADINGEITAIANLSGSLDHDFIRSFVGLYTLNVKSKEEDVFYADQHREKVAYGDKKLQSLLQNKGDSISVMQLRAARLATFSSADGVNGLYWDHQTLSDGSKAFIFCRLNLAEIDIKMPFRESVAANTDESMSSIFYDVKKGDFFLEGVPDLTLRRPVLKYLKSYLGKIFLNSEGSVHESYYTTFQSGDELVVIGREIVDKGLIPVVVINQEKRLSASLAKNKNVVVFSFLCAGFWLFIQTMVFGRGIRLKVGIALILTSLLAISMPFMMGFSVFKLILREAKENEQLKLERELHNVLAGVDSGVRIFHANLYQSFVRALNNPQNIASLQAAEKQQMQIDFLHLQTLEEDPTEGAETIKRIAKDSFRPFEVVNSQVLERKSKANAIMVLGANDFVRFFDRFSQSIVGHRKNSSADPFYHVLNLYRRTIEPFFAKSLIAPGLVSQDKSGSDELKKIFFDELKEQLIATIGADKYLEIFTSFEGLNSLRTNVGITHFSVFPLWSKGIIQFFCGIGWDEMTIGDIYLFNVLDRLNSERFFYEQEEHAIFKWLDPRYYFAKEPVLLQGFGGFSGDTISSGKRMSTVLSSLIKETSRSKRPVRVSSEGRIYQVSPGKYFSFYTIGGSILTSHLAEIENWRSGLFVAGLLLFILFAVFAAINISRSFTGPLEHLLWGIERVEKNDLNVRLKDSREDEFGSISRAFNFMTRRLREREMLGKFVSESVRRLARDPELLRRARLGSEEEVTVVFGNLNGFAEFASRTDAAEVQKKLEFCLGAFFSVAEEFGGEIDKVIGEKLLIVFPHMGKGAKEAAIAAAGMSMRIREMLCQETELSPVLGINCGRVISGIIGTPNVRMDNTVIGDPVNVAARLCSLASASMPVIISGEIKDILGDSFITKTVDVNRIRGKQQEVEVFSLDA